ncbi:FMN-binding protein [Rubripirellula reticaptiva]|uniref:FMN-binding protein n=1 Tax=Rubripirellula reticaptiva TaxID=2528013 RepID=UPI0011B85D11|nr:FMN-binding protein [Rubripirellula reticaptiva]
MVSALLLAIPAPHRKPVGSSEPPPIDKVRDLLQRPSVQFSGQDVNGMWRLTDASGGNVGTITRTLPIARDIVGYRGPSEAMILLDNELQIVAVHLLSSDDTAEHVEAVQANPAFFAQFVGWRWGGGGSESRIDGVSGATLTSLAIAQGVIKRIGGQRPSLVFPDDVTDEERSESIADDDDVSELLRSGPYSDSVIGYQGPTELLLKVGSDDRVEKLAIRKSFDNEPYVDYVRTERGFWKRFTGRTLADLSTMDPAAEGIEGVSGATMTSLAVADTIVAASSGIIRQRTESHDKSTSAMVRWTIVDWITVAMILAITILSRWGAFQSPVGRRAWLVAVVLVIGFWTGNLMSMALLAGWSAHGIAWRLAPGLASMAAVAFLVPPMKKANPYCNHLCPHGALQQLVKPSARSRRRIRLSPRVIPWLKMIPGVTLVAAYVAVVFVPTIDLASWEPFHAYLFRIASRSSLGFAIVTLVASAFIPMGYCRLGCPTGRLIDYIRLTATSDRIRRADIVAISLLMMAWGVQFWRES